ncbi:MAG: hypothetical protein HC789_05180 [Microcoleus sp. CSU_2_2]|nr:hypothetical protein [Microcoleus sp. SU_5_3]NJS09809.1 hypothetical protein [Microcoleus sp. CSU_2_2]
MLQAFEGIYRNGVIELLEFPENISESRVLITFLNAPSIPRSPAFIQFGMFAGTGQSAEADFEIAEFQGDTDDGLDWS